LKTDIYKFKTNPNTYLFIKEGEDISIVPSKTINKLGEVTYVKSITLIPDSPLIAANPNEVILNIEKQGFHIQRSEVKMTVKENDVSEVGAAVGGGILAASLGLGPVGAIAGAALGLWIANIKKTEEDNNAVG